MVPPAHFPRASGGWLDRELILTGILCIVCGGSGTIPEDKSTQNLSLREEILDLQKKLIDAIIQNGFLVTDTKMEWIRVIGNIDLNSSEQYELSELEDLVESYKDDFSDDKDLSTFFLMVWSDLLRLDSMLLREVLIPVSLRKLV